MSYSVRNLINKNTILSCIVFIVLPIFILSGLSYNFLSKRLSTRKGQVSVESISSETIIF